MGGLPSKQTLLFQFALRDIVNDNPTNSVNAIQTALEMGTNDKLNDLMTVYVDSIALQKKVNFKFKDKFKSAQVGAMSVTCMRLSVTDAILSIKAGTNKNCLLNIFEAKMRKGASGKYEYGEELVDDGMGGHTVGGGAPAAASEPVVAKETLVETFNPVLAPAADGREGHAGYVEKFLDPTVPHDDERVQLPATFISTSLVDPKKKMLFMTLGMKPNIDPAPTAEQKGIRTDASHGRIHLSSRLRRGAHGVRPRGRETRGRL